MRPPSGTSAPRHTDAFDEGPVAAAEEISHPQTVIAGLELRVKPGHGLVGNDELHGRRRTDDGSSPAEHRLVGPRLIGPLDFGMRHRLGARKRLNLRLVGGRLRFERHGERRFRFHFLP